MAGGRSAINLVALTVLPIPPILPVLPDSDFDLRRILGGRDAFFDKRVPVVTVRALPEELRAPVSAPHADVGIEIEDGVPGELAVAVDKGWRVPQLCERPPDRLMDAERMRIQDWRARLALSRHLAAGGQVP